jgi:toxoflavin synthase
MSAQYDDIGDQYLRFKESAPLVRAEQNLLVAMLGDLTGLRVLDLACGHGHYTRLCHALGALQVTGVDVSPVMVELAEAATPPSGGAVTFACHDAGDLPVIGAFDVVTAVWLLNYAESRRQLRDMLAGAHRNLRPGGRLVTITLHPDFDPERGGWEPYGVRVLETVAEPHSRRISCELVVPGVAIPLRVVQWDRASYTDAARASGFTDPGWVLAEAPEDDGFWQDFTDNPLITGLRADRPLR